MGVSKFFKLSLLLLCMSFAFKSLAYDVRLYDTTPNVNWIIEVDNLVSSQRAFNADSRDSTGLPLPIAVTSALYLGEWANHIPGVSFALQALSNPGVFFCLTSPLNQYYKIVKSIGLYSCQTANVQAIPQLTVNVQSSSPTLAALVDLKAVAGNRPVSIVSVHSIDNMVPVSDWNRTKTVSCPVTNNSISIVIQDLSNVTCKQTTPNPTGNLVLQLNSPPDPGLATAYPTISVAVQSISNPNLTLTLPWTSSRTQSLAVGTYQVQSASLQWNGNTYNAQFTPSSTFTIQDSLNTNVSLNFIEASPPPTNGQKVIGYYESWAQYRTNLASGYQSAMTPVDIDPNLLTHLVFAFGSFGFQIFDQSGNKSPHNTGDYKIYQWEYNDPQMIAEMVALKTQNPNLKLIYSLGGWNFNLPADAAQGNPYIYSDKTNYLFADMMANVDRAHVQPAPPNAIACTGLSKSNVSDCVLLKDANGQATTSRTQFIQSLIAFLRASKLDGIDLDWEYPGVLTRGGTCNDFTNYLAFVTQLRQAINAEAQSTNQPALLITIAASAALPAGMCPAYNTMDLYMAELKKWQSQADWLGIMSYDFYGPWDTFVGPNAPLNPVIDPATHAEHIAGFNINATVQRYLAAGLAPNKLAVGLATYGRNFASVNFNGTGSGDGTGYGLTASGYGFPGESTGESGLSTYFEILDLIKNRGFTQNYLTDVQSPYIYNKTLNQWVGYDNETSLAAKCKIVAQNNLGGAIVWSVTNDDHAGASGKKFPLLSTVKTCLLGP